jgi:hypothetical protein
MKSAGYPGTIVFAALMLALTTRAVQAELNVSHSEPRLVSPNLEQGPSPGNAQSLAKSGDGWLAVYVGQPTRLFGRLIGPDGTPLGAPFDIASDFIGISAEVQFDGSAFVVAWLGTTGNGRVTLHSQRVSTAGELVGARNLLTTFDEWRNPQLTTASITNGALVVVCTIGQSNTFCKTWTVDELGALEGDIIETAQVGWPAKLARSGDTLLAVLDDGVGHLSFVRLNTDGTFLDEAPVPFASGAGTEGTPVPIGVDEGFAVVWSDDGSERLTTIDLEGSIATKPSPIPYTGLGALTGISTPTGAALVGRDCADCPATLRLFSSDWQAVGAPVAIGGGSATWRMILSGTADSSRMLAFWDTSGLVNGSLATQAVAQLIDLNDLQTEHVTLPVSVGFADQSHPRSAPGPGGWLVSWSEASTVHAQLVDELGEPRGNPIRLGGETQFFGIGVLAVSGGPDGWLVIWRDSNSVWATLVDAQGGIAESLLGTPDVAHQALRSGSGWTVGFNDYDLGSERFSFSTLELDDEAQTSGSRPYSAPSGLRVPFDIAKLDQGYRAWWGIDSQIVSKDVVGSNVTDGPVLEVPSGTVSFLTTTAESLLCCDSAWCYFASTSQPKWSFMGNVIPSDLVDVNGVAAVALVKNDGSYVAELHLSEDGSPLVQMDTVYDADSPALSEPVEDKVLLTFTRRDDVAGKFVQRSYLSIVSFDDTNLRGAAGAASAGPGGAAGADGERAGGTAGAPSSVVGEAGNLADPNTRSTNGIERESPWSGPPRTSRSCGCRVAGHRVSSDGFAALVLLCLAWVRRARRARG